MQSQPTSLILLAEVRHAELQAEAAQQRLVHQARPTRFPPTSIMADVRRRLGTTLASTRTVLQSGLTFAHMRQRTTRFCPADLPPLSFGASDRRNVAPQ